MSQRAFGIVVVLIFLLNGEIFAQEKFLKKISYAHVLSLKASEFTSITYYRNSRLSSMQNDPIASSINLNYPFKLQPVSADYYCKGLGFICQNEWRFEKATKLPLRLRLGSLAYVDQMEGKK
jgi:hypothetical protein